MKKILLAIGITLSLVSVKPHANTLFENIVSLLAGVLNIGVFPESDLYTTDDDIIIVADDGVTLAANVFVPTFGTGNYPVVIFINSWALNEYEYLSEAARFAEEGYVVLSYSTRGFGTSGGVINTAGPLDMADLSNVIDFLIAHYDINEDAIGVAGISYGSGISLLGAAHDPRIKAVGAMSTWGSLLESLYGQDTPRLIWGELLTLTSVLTGNPDPEIEQTWQYVLNRENLADIYAFTEPRSPLSVVDTINANGTAVYIAQNWGDNLFQPNSVVELFSALTVPKHIDLQPGTHAGTEIGGLLGDGNIHVFNNLHRWFAQHLKGELDAMEGQKPVNMKVKLTSGYEQFDDFPVPEATDSTYYLQPRGVFSNGDLTTTPYQRWYTSDNTVNSLVDTVASTQIPIASQIFEQASVPVSTDLFLLSRPNSILFETPSLDDTMEIRGTPHLSIMLAPKSETVQLVAYLYDQNPWGLDNLITHKPVTLHDAVPGVPVRIELPLSTTAYNVPAGHKLTLVIDTKDLLYAKPDGVFAVDIEYSSSEQSVLTIPQL